MLYVICWKGSVFSLYSLSIQEYEFFNVMPKYLRNKRLFKLTLQNFSFLAYLNDLVDMLNKLLVSDDYIKAAPSTSSK